MKKFKGLLKGHVGTGSDRLTVYDVTDLWVDVRQIYRSFQSKPV